MMAEGEIEVPVDGLVGAHSARCEYLTDEIRRLEEELYVHKLLLELLTDDRFCSVLTYFYEDPDRPHSQDDVARYASECGVTLPEGSSMRILESDELFRWVEVDLQCGNQDWTITWAPGHDFVTTFHRDTHEEPVACRVDSFGP